MKEILDANGPCVIMVKTVTFQVKNIKNSNFDLQKSQITIREA